MIEKLLFVVILSFLISCNHKDSKKVIIENEKKIVLSHNDLEIKYDLKDSNNDTLIEVEIGEINLPSGKIIVGDPFFTFSVKPLTKTVTPGKYPVKIYLRKINTNHYRIAFSKIKFKEEKANNWSLAISDDMNLHELNNLEDDEYFGFIVDSGLGCFLDSLTNEIYNKKLDDFEKKKGFNYYNNILAKEFKEYSGSNKYSRELGDWNNHIVDKTKNLNIIMFQSGWGDGYYPTYWGYNNKNEIVELTIDFMLNFE